MPEHAESHGHSRAAWTGVTIIMVGSAVMAVAMIFALTWLFVVGAVIVVAGVVAGKVLSMAGYDDKLASHDWVREGTGHDDPNAPRPGSRAAR